MKVIVSEAIIQIVQKALNSPRGIEITFDTEGMAINFLQRYNRVRKQVIGGNPESEWRTLTGRRYGNAVRITPVDAHVEDYPIKEL